MASPADIARLVANMQRADALVNRAAADSEKNTAIMDRFEARLGLIGSHFAKIDEYERQLAAMDAMGNGGPPLDATFPAATPSAPTSSAATVTSSSSFDHATGDPVK